MAAHPIAFHFDFISPYGFFASREVEALAARHGRTVDWRPMLLGVSVLKVMGLKPLLDTPLKGDYVRRDVQRHARKLGIALGRDFDAPVGNPLPAARAFYWVKDRRPDLQSAMTHALYHAYWIEGRDLSTPQAVASVELPPGIEAAELAQAITTDAAASRLRAAVSESLDAGIFGSPTLVVDGEPFWGFDRLGDVDEWLARGGW
jgi:2-hydroxychromene-2-carboxylate isomerase